MFQLIKKLLETTAVQQFIKYGIVGVIGLGVDLGTYYLLIAYFDVHFLVAHIISASLGIVNNFILNSYFTFKVTDERLKRFFTFATIGVVGMVISSALLTFLVEIVELSEMISKIISIIIVALLQFIINKFITFKEKK